MKVTVENKSGSVVNLDIAADPEEFAEAVEKTFKSLSKSANIKGFRRGKAPRHIIESMIGREAIVAEAGRGMMDDLYRQALEQEDLQPISEPEVDVYEEDPLAFRVEVEVFPSVELGDYKSVSVEPREVTVSDEEVEEEIEELRKNFSEWVEIPIARTPKDGDQVIIDLAVFEGDEVFQEPAEDAEFVLGEDNLFESLQEAIKMMEPGSSSELTLAFEDDDTSVRPELRGKTLRYQITLKAVKTRKLPEFNDEFAAEVGEFDSADELRDEVRADVLRRKAVEARNEVRSDIVEKVTATSEVEVPQTLVESELNDSIQNMQTRFAQQGLRFEDYLAQLGQTEQELREELRDDAEKRVRQTLVLQQVWEAEGLEITDEDIDKQIDKLTAGQENPERMREIYRSDYFREMLESEIHDTKLMEHLVELATDGQGEITGPGAEQLAADEEAQQAAMSEAETGAETAESDTEASAADAGAEEPATTDEEQQAAEDDVEDTDEEDEKSSAAE